MAARLGYVVVVLLATLSELRLDADPASVAERLQRAFSVDVSARDMVDGVRNVLLFAGWGLVWSLTSPNRGLMRSIPVATIAGMLLSMAVETVQLFSPLRHASILDVASNTMGAFLGAAAAVALLRATAAASGARSFVGVPMFLLALGYGGAALLEILLPGLRQEMLGGSSGGPLNRFRLAVTMIDWSLPAAPELLLQTVLMLPAGAFALAALVEHGRTYREALLASVLAGVTLALVLELARGASGQMIQMGVFWPHAVGLAGGAWLAYSALPGLTRRLRGAQRPLALLISYTAVLALWRWRPFIPELDLQQLLTSFSFAHIVPLHALSMKMDIFSASIVAVGFLLHLPIGALLAAWPLRLHGPLRHLLAGFWIVLVIEAGQIFVADRFFDVTDIIIGAAGVAAGWAFVRRAGFRPYGELLPGRKRTGQ